LAEAKESHLVKNWSMLLFAVAAAFTFCSAAAEDAVVANVNGNQIKKSDLDFAASEVGPQLSQVPVAERRGALLQFVIENELMAEAADKDKLGEATTFQGRLAYHKRRALRDAYYDKAVRDGVSDSDAKAIYEQKIKDVKPQDEIHARHILVTSEEEAKQVIERLKKGEDFATVAKEKSKDPNAEGGGLGWFTRGQMLKPFDDAAFALEVGQISQPVQTQFGWHVIKVEGKRQKPAPTFEQVKDMITAQLIQQKAQQITRELQGQAKIEIVDPEIKKAMQGSGAPQKALP
jgi:peptidyl-prolyl cis-trans isomerase C